MPREMLTHGQQNGTGVYTGAGFASTCRPPGPAEFAPRFIAGARELLASALLLTSCWMVISNLGTRFSRCVDTCFESKNNNFMMGRNIRRTLHSTGLVTVFT